jgi:serine/threonine protein kinase
VSGVDKDRWQVLSPHLDRGLELTGEDRAAWIAALRAQDAALADAVEALLHELDALEQEGFLAGQSPAPDPPCPALPPERIGPYRILRELRRGGMGCVYLAEQEGQDFRRLVALKVVESGNAGAEAERRFRDERRILAGLEHPGIARFYDAGRTPEGHWFLALEYVDGPNLLEHARQRDLGIEEKVRLMLEVLDAVAFAHARSVVHRDLKPSNILVGADGRPRLLDFGIAKIIHPDPAVPATETRTEVRALTPAYASPEQFRGDRATPASDVFSLGVVLYELVAGVRPFAAASTSRAEVERAVLNDDPPPPSAAWQRAGGARRGLGRDLDAICLKALRKEPGRRYASAGPLAKDLRRCLEGRAVAALADNRRYRLVRFGRRHRGRLASAAALALAVVAMLVPQPPSGGRSGSGARRRLPRGPSRSPRSAGYRSGSPGGASPSGRRMSKRALRWPWGWPTMAGRRRSR